MVGRKSPVGMRLGVHDPKALTDFAINKYPKINHMGPDKFEQFRLFTLAGDCRYTMEAAEKFGQFDRRDDRLGGQRPVAERFLGQEAL